MNLDIKQRDLLNTNMNHKQDGFTLVETMVSLIILLAALGGILPVFVTYRLGAINNQLETGAIAVSQGVLDEIRQTEWRFLPAGNAEVITNDEVTYLGKDYDYRTTYCPDGALPANVFQCDGNAKFIRVEVFFNDQEIYEAETIYSRFE